MKPSHQDVSRLQIQKFFNRARDYCKLWVESTKYYASEALFDILCYSALERCSVEQGSRQLKELGTAPSGETVRNQTKKQYDGLEQKVISELVADLLQYLVSRMPHFRGNRRPEVVLALDLHDEEYYGKNLFDQSGNRLVFGTPQGKSDKSLRYGTLSIVQLGDLSFPLTIGFMACHVGQSRKEVVKQLLEQIDLPMKINRLLLDGGFASLGVLKYLELELQIPWITRGKYSSKKEYLGEINDQWFPYRLKDKFEIPAYLIQHEGSEQPVLLLCSRRWTPTTEKTKQIYKMRFRIENTYRHARKMKIITTTRDIQLRWILWAIAHFLEVLWQILRYVHQIQDLDEDLIRQKRFMFIISRLLEAHFVSLQLLS